MWRRECPVLRRKQKRLAKVGHIMLFWVAMAPCLTQHVAEVIYE